MTDTSSLLLFFFNDTATTEIYTLSLHDALPISHDTALTLYKLSQEGELKVEDEPVRLISAAIERRTGDVFEKAHGQDRKSTRLNSSHANISYAVFCLKKKKHAHASTAIA